MITANQKAMEIQRIKRTDKKYKICRPKTLAYIDNIRGRQIISIKSELYYSTFSVGSKQNTRGY